MRNMRKEIKGCFILVLLIVIGLTVKFGYGALADNQNVWIEVNGEKVTGELNMKTRALNLMLRSEGVVYDSDDYKIKWSIPITEHLDIISFQDTPGNIYEGSGLTNCVIKAKKPGTAQVQLEIIDATGGSSAGGIVASVTCNIKVVYGIDTEGDPLSYQYIMEDDTERSLVMYTEDVKDLKLSIGDATTDVAWKSENIDVAKVNNGTVTAVGSGVTTVTVESAEGSDQLKVYVIPKFSNTGAEGSFGVKKTYNISSGDLLYTDTLFEDNQTLTLKDKIVWAIYKYDTNNNRILMEDSLGNMNSDLIELTPTGTGTSVPKHLTVKAKAGVYYVDFYPKGAYLNDTKKNTSLANTTKIIVSGNIKEEQEVTLNIGDQYSIPNAINITEEEFARLFTVKQTSGNNGIIDYNSTTGIVTARESDGASITMTVTPRKDANSDDIKALYGGADPKAFHIIIRVVDQLILDQSNIRLVVGEERQLTPTVVDFEGDYQWSSNNEQCVSVTENGLVKGIKATQEDAVITVSLKQSNGTIKRATCKVKVVETASSITLDQTDVSMEIGAKTTITANFNPDRSEAPINWVSTDTEVASINVSGDNKSIVVTANKAGTATIVAMNKDNYVTAYCKITVLSPIRTLTLDETQLTVKLSQEIVRLKYTYGPTDATSKELEWASSDTSIATVDETGLVTLKKAGVTIITVSPAYNVTPPIMAQCIITVQQSAEGLQLSPGEVTLNVGEKQQLNYNFIPESATSTVTTWTSFNEKIAVVSSSGEITAIAPGETYIVGRTEEGYVATAYIKVLQAATDISLESKNITLYTGEKHLLAYSLQPANATSQVTFELIDPTGNSSKIVKVTSDGEITALAAGEVDILAKTEEGNTTSCHIVVLQSAQGVSILPEEISLKVGEDKTITPTLNPFNATSVITWLSFDESIVKVDKNGTVTGVSVGQAYIIVKTQEGHMAKCLVNVWQASEGFTLDEDEIIVELGSKIQVKYTTKPANAIVNLKWLSTNDAIVKVNKNGVVEGVSIGTTVIVATDENGNQDTCKVTVIQKPTSISVPASVRVKVGSTLKLNVTLIPENTTEKKLTWSTANDRIATISNGVISGKKKGYTVITVKTSNHLTETIFVEVYEYKEVTGVSINPTKKTITKGRTYQLQASVKPSNASNKAVKWKSSNSSIVSVSSTGKIKGLKGGVATITCTSAEKSYKATCTVTVVEKATSIKLNVTSKTLVSGKKYKLKATVKSNYAAKQKLVWSSSNKSIATVSGSGVVKAKKIGKCRIKVSTTDGSKKYATCTIRVVRKATSIKLNKTYLKIVEGKRTRLSATVKPKNATNRRVNWSSSNSEIAMVTSDGRITALTEGRVKITAVAKDGSGKKAICVVDVQKAVPVTSISLTSQDMVLVKGTSSYLPVNIQPVNHTNKTYYSSDNIRVATVTSKGKVTAKSPGQTTITIRASNGVQTSVTITVVGLNKISLHMEQYDTETLWLQEISTGVKWASLNPRIATVSNGTVTAKRIGKTRIVAYYKGTKLYCDIYVNKIR